MIALKFGQKSSNFLIFNVINFSTFSLGKHMNWTDTFSLVDGHLKTSKQNGFHWNSHVLESLTAAFENFETFGINLVAGHDDLECRLKSLLDMAVGKKVLQAKLAEEEKALRSEGLSMRKIKIKLKRLRNKLQMESFDVVEGLEMIVNFSQQIWDDAKNYIKTMNPTVGTLETFKKSLVQDKNNFKSDNNLLDNIDSMIRREVFKLQKDYRRVWAELGASQYDVPRVKYNNVPMREPAWTSPDHEFNSDQKLPIKKVSDWKSLFESAVNNPNLPVKSLTFEQSPIAVSRLNQPNQINLGAAIHKYMLMNLKLSNLSSMLEQLAKVRRSRHGLLEILHILIEKFNDVDEGFKLILESWNQIASGMEFIMVRAREAQDFTSKNKKKGFKILKNNLVLIANFWKSINRNDLKIINRLVPN